MKTIDTVDVKMKIMKVEKIFSFFDSGLNAKKFLLVMTGRNKGIESNRLFTINKPSK